jgi:hypothetical protein
MSTRPLTEKWDKHMNVDLKEFKKKLKVNIWLKIINEYGQGESKIEGCKVCNTLIGSQEVEVGAMGVRALATCANSLHTRGLKFARTNKCGKRHVPDLKMAWLP